jgi:hypothetical protein
MSSFPGSPKPIKGGLVVLDAATGAVNRAGRSFLLQRKCACGAEACGLTGDCSDCSNKIAGLQTKLRINELGDACEQEADRVAEQVLAEPAHSEVSRSPLRVQRHVGQAAAEANTAPASVDRVLASPGRPLEPALRQDMEQRFGHDFSRVRVHANAAAEQSAREVNANAYTVGRNMVFGEGRFAPATREGQWLIAHELTHVVQQSGNGGTGVAQGNDKRGLPSNSPPTLIQRQPDDPPKKDPPQKQTAQKTLKSEKVDVTDLVGKNTATIIDEVLARNQKLAPYIGDKLTGGFKIAEKGKFIHDSTDGNFDDAYRKAYDLNSSNTVPKDVKGFVDPKTSEIHVRPSAQFGTALHESVHRLASPALYRSYLRTAKISTDMVEVLKEGITAFFTDSILKDEGLPNFNDAYRNQKKKVETLITALGSDGFDLIAKLHFKGNIIEIGEKLGFTAKQFNAAPGDGIREVVKRMEQAM